MSEALARVPALVPDVVVLEVAPSEIAEFTVAVCAGTVTGQKIPIAGSISGAVFADQAALALQRAESQPAQRELEVLADRDLHDHV